MNFRREIVKKCIAQMCLNLGWEGITTSALDTLTNVLENYFFTVSHVTHLTSEWKDYPELSFQDLYMSFDKLNINLADLSDYISLADHTPLPISVPYFPALRHKLTIKSGHKTLTGKDNQTSVDKKQGNECLTPIKNSKIVPKEAEASQYEMKSFSLVTLENGDLFPEIKGHAPNPKIHKLVPAEDSTYKNSKIKSLTLNVNKPFLDANKEKNENKRPKHISDYVGDVEDKSYSKIESPNMPFSSMKKHRKPTTKEVLIAKKKQSQFSKLATRMVKVDSFDANSEHKKKRPGRKPKKVPKSRPLIAEADEIDVITAMTPIEMDKSDYLMEVVNTVVEETLISKQNDTMLEGDLELGAVNDEMLVEIADRGGDSPLSHLTGIPIQNRELFNNTDIFGSSCQTKEAGNTDPQVNIDVEEEILPWSDDEKPKEEDSVANKATGLELILRSQGDDSSNGSILYMSPEKNHRVDNLSQNDKDKKKLKKLKKLKKSQKHDKYPKTKKNRSDILNDPIGISTDERSYGNVKATTDDHNNKYSFCDLGKAEETFESYHTATKFSENSDFNDSEHDLNNLEKMPQAISSVEPSKITQENISKPEISHKKKKKKGKRKQEEMDEIAMPKSKKVRKESLEAPVIPKLTLKFGGATVCGGVTSSPNFNRDIENSSRHSLPAPIKLVIKPNVHGNTQKKHSLSPEPVHYSPTFSPSYHQRPFSPDQLSIPSVALSSRSPSPNDIARLASGPSNRKNLSSIYSESPSPPHDGQGASKVFNPRKHLHPHIKQKNKEPKRHHPPSVKSSPFNKSNANKSCKSSIVSETVGKITKENGEIIWICPTCGCADSGTPMIGCDRCDDWYHWTCVNITKEPPAEMNWYCVRCLSQNPSLKSQMPNKRGRPAGKGKSKK